MSATVFRFPSEQVWLVLYTPSSDNPQKNTAETYSYRLIMILFIRCCCCVAQSGPPVDPAERTATVHFRMNAVLLLWPLWSGGLRSVLFSSDCFNKARALPFVALLLPFALSSPAVDNRSGILELRSCCACAASDRRKARGFLSIEKILTSDDGTDTRICHLCRHHIPVGPVTEWFLVSSIEACQVKSTYELFLGQRLRTRFRILHSFFYRRANSTMIG
jgi:hypothetical protein